MNLESKKTFLIKLAYLVAVVALIYCTLKFAVPVILPFIIGFAVAFILNKPIRKISAKLNMKRTIVGIVMLLLFYAVVGLVLFFAGRQLIDYIRGIIGNLPDIYYNDIEPALNNLLSSIEEIIQGFSPSTTIDIEQLGVWISGNLDSVSKWGIGAITGFATGIPMMFLNVLFAIVSSFFFALDYDRIKNFVLRQFSDKAQKIILDVKNHGISTVFKYIKAYGMILSATFIQLFVGFLILGIPNAAALAFLVSFVDILPVLGTGTVVIPWAIVSLLTSNIFLGVGLLILYVVITVVRQILEPRIVGDQIGLHPLITLICMVVGLVMFGIVGLFLFPFTAAVMKNLNDRGIVKLYK